MKKLILFSLFFTLLAISVSAEEIQKKIYVEIENHSVTVRSKESEHHKFLCSNDNDYIIYLPLDVNEDCTIKETTLDNCEDENARLTNERDKEKEKREDAEQELIDFKKEDTSGESCDKRVDELKELHEKEIKRLTTGFTIQGAFLIIMFLAVVSVSLIKILKKEKP